MAADRASRSWTCWFRAIESPPMDPADQAAQGRIFAAEVYMFDRLVEDGRIRRIDQIAKRLDEAE